MAKNPPGTSGKRHIAIYPGSFDPVTFGHLDVIRRGRRVFDKVIVAVGRNPGKDTLFSAEERTTLIRQLVGQIERDEPDQAPVEVDAFEGLTVDFARRIASANGGRIEGIVLLRGIRNLSDLQNEVQQALTNRQVAGLETAFVVAGQDFAYTSSSLIKQITALGGDDAMAALKTMVPAEVIERLRQKKRDRHPALERLQALGGGAEG